MKNLNCCMWERGRPLPPTPLSCLFAPAPARVCACIHDDMAAGRCTVLHEDASCPGASVLCGRDPLHLLLPLDKISIPYPARPNVEAPRTWKLCCYQSPLPHSAPPAEAGVCTLCRTPCHVPRLAASLLPPNVLSACGPERVGAAVLASMWPPPLCSTPCSDRSCFGGSCA